MSYGKVCGTVLGLAMALSMMAPAPGLAEGSCKSAPPFDLAALKKISPTEARRTWFIGYLFDDQGRLCLVPAPGQPAIPLSWPRDADTGAVGPVGLEVTGPALDAATNAVAGFSWVFFDVTSSKATLMPNNYSVSIPGSEPLSIAIGLQNGYTAPGDFDADGNGDAGSFAPSDWFLETITTKPDGSKTVLTAHVDNFAVLTATYHLGDGKTQARKPLQIRCNDGPRGSLYSGQPIAVPPGECVVYDGMNKDGVRITALPGSALDVDVGATDHSASDKR